jgi:hypothetical protein
MVVRDAAVDQLPDGHSGPVVVKPELDAQGRKQLLERAALLGLEQGKAGELPCQLLGPAPSEREENARQAFALGQVVDQLIQAVGGR